MKKTYCECVDILREAEEGVYINIRNEASIKKLAIAIEMCSLSGIDYYSLSQIFNRKSSRHAASDLGIMDYVKNGRGVILAGNISDKAVYMYAYAMDKVRKGEWNMTEATA